MQARAHVLALAALGILAVAPLALAEDEPAPPEPPSITYGASRSSSAWIEKPDGSRVAVGEGVSWQGVKVYLSLLWDLVGVDEATGRTLYAVHVGAFWNEIHFVELKGDGGLRWAVELRPGPRARRGADKRQYHDLRTGADIGVPDEGAPAGDPFEPRAAWRGRASRIDKPFAVLVASEAGWRALRIRMFGADGAARFGGVDFDKEVVLVVSGGNAWNCDGYSVEAAWSSESRTLVRMRRHTYQTEGGGRRTRPFGIFVLPRRAEGEYVVERDRQNLIGGPPLWEEGFRGRTRPAEAELADVPPATEARHEGWDKPEPRRPAPPPRRPDR